MPEHLRVFIIILTIAIIAFASGRAAIEQPLIDPEDYKRRRNAWFALSALAFLSHNFWLFIGGSLLLSYLFGRRENNTIALYVMMLLAVPGFSQPLPGFAGINYLFDANHERMVGLGLLLPAAIHLYRKGNGRNRSLRLLDQLVALFIGWIVLRHYMDSGVTEGARTAFNLAVDAWLPYYVTSRCLRSIGRFHDAMATFVVVCVIAGAIAMFEMWRGWLLYTELRYAMGLPQPSYLIYLQRGGLGLIRAQSSLNHPIIVGYVMMFGLAMLTICARYMKVRLVYQLALLSIGGGLIASLSRGPWVGTAVMMMTIVALDPSVGRRVSRTIGAALVVMVVLFATPLGSTVIDLLPWVGSVESENVDYRTRLFEVSLEVIRQNLWMGDLEYLANPLMEEMRQGQGIIDITNSYLEIALPYGIVGLAAFVAPFLVCLSRLRRTLRGTKSQGVESERLGRTLFALLLGMLVTIATVSGIGVITELYWILVGMSGAYVAHLQHVREDAQSDSAAAAAEVRSRAPRGLSEGY